MRECARVNGRRDDTAPRWAMACGLQALWCAAFRDWARAPRHFWLSGAILSAEAMALGGAHSVLRAAVGAAGGMSTVCVAEGLWRGSGGCGHSRVGALLHSTRCCLPRSYPSCRTHPFNELHQAHRVNEAPGSLSRLALKSKSNPSSELNNEVK